MKATVDDKNCIGCGACTTICPEVFHMDEKVDSIAESYVSPIPEYFEATAQKAEAGCPVDAIHIQIG